MDIVKHLMVKPRPISIEIQDVESVIRRRPRFHGNYTEISSQLTAHDFKIRLDYCIILVLEETFTKLYSCLIRTYWKTHDREVLSATRTTSHPRMLYPAYLFATTLCLEA